MKLIKEKAFYKSLLALTVPIVLQNLINVGVSMLDTVMLAGLDQSALSASMLANQLYFILIVAFFGVAGGASVLTSQYWGKNDTSTIRRIMGMSLRYAVIIAALFSLAAIFAPRVVMSIYTDKENLILLGVKYLRIIGFSYILSAVTVVYLGIIRSAGNVRVATAVYSLSMLVNGVLNYLLIFGNFGFPKMGIEGAALATLIARVCEIVFVAIYALAVEKKIHFKLKYLFYRSRTLFSDFLRYSAPVIINELAWSLGFSMQSAVLGHLSEDAVAANSIISVASGDGRRIWRGQRHGGHGRQRGRPGPGEAGEKSGAHHADHLIWPGDHLLRLGASHPRLHPGVRFAGRAYAFGACTADENADDHRALHPVPFRQRHEYYWGAQGRRRLPLRHDFRRRRAVVFFAAFGATVRVCAENPGGVGVFCHDA